MTSDNKDYSEFGFTNDKPYTFDRFVRLLLSIAIIIGLILIIRSISNVLVPFFIALLLAYLTDPIVVFIQTRIKIRKRGPAVFLTLLLFVSLFMAILWWLIPQFIKEFTKMGELIRLYFQTHNFQEFIPEGVQNWLQNFFSSHSAQEFLNAENVSQITSILWQSIRTVFSGSIQFLLAIFGFFLIFLYLFFILLDYKKVEEDWQSLIPAKHRSLVMNISEDLKKSMKVYFRAQSSIAFIVGILLAVGFSIIKLPMAVSLGLFIGMLNIVPYLQLLGFAPALFLALLKSMETGQSFGQIVFLVFLVILIVQLIQETILIPRIMGKAYNMNPALILLSLSVWGSIMGILGMLLALPFTTLIVSYYKQLILKEKATRVEKSGTHRQPEDESLS
jgi:predicted PurR-regulated permease PerM